MLIATAGTTIELRRDIAFLLSWVIQPHAGDRTIRRHLSLTGVRKAERNFALDGVPQDKYYSRGPYCAGPRFFTDFVGRRR